MARTRGPIPVARLPYALFRRASVPAGITAGLCIIVSVASSGRAGGLGALIGACIVIAFYVTDLLALRLAERMSGNALLPLMLIEYAVKVSGIALFLAVIWDTTAFSTSALAATITFATVVWTLSLAYFAARSPTYIVDIASLQHPPEP